MSTTEDHQVKIENITTEAHKLPDADIPVRKVTRRSVLMNIGIGLNALVGLAITAPVIGYIIGPAIRKKGFYKSWVSLGNLNRYPNGQTRFATFVSPYRTPTDGATDNTACWVGGSPIQVFRCSRSIARILVVPYGGSRSRAYSCVPATAACTTRTALVRPAPRSVACSSTSGSWSTANCRSTRASYRRCRTRQALKERNHASAKRERKEVGN